jgi:S-adenosylmethionine uptake transporter
MQNSIWPVLLLVLAQLLWAASWLVTKKLIGDISPIFLYILEGIFAFIVTIPFIFFFSREFKNLKGNFLWWVFISAILAVVGTIIYYIAFKKVPFTVASLSALSYPLFCTLLAILFLKEALTIKFVIAASFMVIGFLVLLF